MDEKGEAEFEDREAGIKWFSLHGNANTMLMLISFSSNSRNHGVAEAESPGKCAKVWLLLWTSIGRKISPISSVLDRVCSWLPTLSTFAPCEEERIRSRRQYYHLWSFYTVSSTELYTVYSSCSSSRSSKGWRYPMLQTENLKVQKDLGFPDW